MRLTNYTLVSQNPLMHHVILSYKVRKLILVIVPSSDFFAFYIFTITNMNLFPKTTWQTIILFFSTLKKCTDVVQSLTLSFSQFSTNTHHYAFQTGLGFAPPLSLGYRKYYYSLFLKYLFGLNFFQVLLYETMYITS